MDLNSSVDRLKGVGEKTARALLRLNIRTIGDLIEHYPRNYDIYKEPVEIGSLVPGRREAVSFVLNRKPEVAAMRRLQVVTLNISDATGSLLLKWYNMPYLRNSLQIGSKYVFRGNISVKQGRMTMEQPEVLTDGEYEKKLDFMQPVYPLTEGINNNLLIKLIRQALAQLDLSREFLPEQIRRRYHLAEYNFAIAQIHFPENQECMLKARKRLVFDEFYLFAMAIRQMKDDHERMDNRYQIKDFDICDTFIKMLAFPLTNAQQRTWEEIKSDIASAKVMNRLIQGDVGSGKTVIAQLALLAAAKAGYQGCLMAPTEVLAKQHYDSFCHDFEAFGIRIELLTGSMTAKEKREAYERISAHEADIIIGTHALIQEKVGYDKLALVVTDEQHRFGVRQREFLSGKGDEPHVLVMSATPIPRTLAIILYGDLDISVIDELPARRLPIKNCAVDKSYRPKAYQFMEQQVRMGHQVYVICPMVEESELTEAENVIDYAAKLKKILPGDITVEFLHGKQKPKEKNEIMERFAENKIQVLVSTTVVEVGVNVPNATVMLIEDAQRFGLAQLHQLRGRVGRGEAQSYCIFMNTSDKPEASDRLSVLVKSNDGFFIAGEDLKMRGPGDLFGLKQSGLMEFKIGDLFNDMNILKEAGDAAKEIDVCLLPEDSDLKQKLNAYMRRTLNDLVL